MAHSFAGRGRSAADETDQGLLFHLALDVFSRLLLGRAADLSDHDHAMRVRVAIIGLKHVDEAGAVDRIPPDAHAGALSDAQTGQLIDGFVGQRS